MSESKPRTRRRRTAKAEEWGLGGRIFGACFSLPFLGGGIAVFFMMFLRPVASWIEARDWIGTPAVIVESGLDSKRGSDSNSYRIKVRYEYRFEGSAFEGRRYGFDESSTNIGVGKMREKVARLAPGSETICWVNPANPREAVLDRGLAGGAIIGLPFSMPFLLVGICGVGWSLFGPALMRAYRRRSSQLVHGLIREGRLPWPRSLAEDVWEQEDTAVIIARDLRLLTALGASAICIFWNGIVAVFLIVMVVEWISGEGVALFLALFLIPFVTIGAIILWSAWTAWRSVLRENWVALISPVPGLAGGEVDVGIASVGSSSPARFQDSTVRFVALEAPLDAENDSPKLSFKRQLGFGRRRAGEPARWWRKQCESALAEIAVPVGVMSGCARISLPRFPDSPNSGNARYSRAWHLEIEDAAGMVESHAVAENLA